MPRGTPAFLSWPWQYLTGRDPVPYAVPPTVQPTMDVVQHNEELQIYREEFAMAAGSNSVILPGYQREAVLNDTLSGVRQGARRWLTLACALDANTASGDNFQLTWQLNGIAHSLLWLNGGSLWPANTPMPLVRSGRMSGASASPGVVSQVTGYPGSVYVPDPAILFLAILSMAGTETLTVSGVYLEADSIFTPIPDMF